MGHSGLSDVCVFVGRGGGSRSAGGDVMCERDDRTPGPWV